MAFDIPYGPDPRHRLDIYLPDQTNSVPVLMFVSGGNWSEGSKEWVGHVGPTLNAYGIGVVAVDHRLQPDVGYKEQVADLAQAFAWIKDNIDSYGGNGSRVFVGGHSAGAHLISLLATDSRYLHAQQLNPMGIRGVVSVALALPGFDEESDPGRFVRMMSPPFLLLVGDSDDVAGVETTQHFHQQLTGGRVKATYDIIPGRDHYDIVHYIGEPDDPVTEHIAAWIHDRA